VRAPVHVSSALPSGFRPSIPTDPKILCNRGIPWRRRWIVSPGPCGPGTASLGERSAPGHPRRRHPEGHHSLNHRSAIVLLSFARARCRRTRSFTEVSPILRAVSCAERPSRSRRTTTERCLAGSSSSAASRSSVKRAAASASSGLAAGVPMVGGCSVARSSIAMFVDVSADSSWDMGMLRLARVPVVRARFRRIRKSQVNKVERPSNRWIPRSAATHVSCTMSWASSADRTCSEAV